MLDLKSQTNQVPERGWWLKEPASDRLAFGMVLHLINGEWTVARTLIGSPAEKAGVKTGEKLASVDGYEVGREKGDMYELQQLMLADSSRSHQLTFVNGKGKEKRDVEKRPLRELLEHDYDNGGATLRGCVGCRTCRPLTIGATDCSSGCPGNYCTVG